MEGSIIMSAREEVQSLSAEVALLQETRRRAKAIADARAKENADLLVKLARLQRELEALKRREPADLLVRLARLKRELAALNRADVKAPGEIAE